MITIYVTDKGACFSKTREQTVIDNHVYIKNGDKWEEKGLLQAELRVIDITNLETIIHSLNSLIWEKEKER